MPVVKLSLDDLEPDRAELPAGTYRVRVDQIEEGRPREGAQSIKVAMTVIDGEHVGATINDWLYDTAKARCRIGYLAAACGVDVNGPTEVDTSTLVGTEVHVTVAADHFTEPDGRVRTRAKVAFRGYAPAQDDFPF